MLNSPKCLQLLIAEPACPNLKEVCFAWELAGQAIPNTMNCQRALPPCSQPAQQLWQTIFKLRVSPLQKVPQFAAAPKGALDLIGCFLYA